MNWKERIGIVLFEEICCKWEVCEDCPLYDKKVEKCLRNNYDSYVEEGYYE